jgi:hypothetical protein
MAQPRRIVNRVVVAAGSGGPVARSLSWGCLDGRPLVSGDWPTGPLHLGHDVGSLRQRVALQRKHATYVLIADPQALTDHVDAPDLVREHLMEVGSTIWPSASTPRWPPWSRRARCQAHDPWPQLGCRSCL